MYIQEAISRLVNYQDLNREESADVMYQIMEGNITSAQIASLITALRMKGEAISEITGFAIAIRNKAVRIRAGDGIVVDTCGTGGDAKNTFNISTAAAFVAAGAGLKVAKHGNTSVSSRCGSADVLRSLNINVEAGIKTVERSIEKANIGFLFAPLLHPSMKYARAPRREIGIRTIFNIIGPLANPAGATRRVLGVYSEHLTTILAEVLKHLGDRHAFIVHGLDGMDEITTTDRTKICELVNDEIKNYYLDPEEFGIRRSTIEELMANTPDESANAIKGILEGVRGPKRDITLLNASAALIAGELAKDFREGIALASRSIDSGNALKALIKLQEISWQTS